MWVYRLILWAVITIFFEKVKAPLQQEDPTLLYASDLTDKEIIRFSVAQCLHHNKYLNKNKAQS